MPYDIKKTYRTCLFILLILPMVFSVSAQDIESVAIPAQTIEEQLEDTVNHTFVGVVTNWYSRHMNLGGVTLLMTIESSFIPFPSEVIIPPAVYVAEEPGSALNLTDSYLLNVLIIVLFGDRKSVM